jgi:lipid A disaccharide synthetase
VPESEVIGLRREVRQLLRTAKEMQDKIDALQNQASDAVVMVPMYVHLPHDVYQKLRSRSEETGQVAAELASLWLWRAVREF